MQITITQEIDFERSYVKRCWWAKVEWTFNVTSGLIETAEGRENLNDYTATVEDRSILDFVLIDDGGNEFACQGNGNCLPDYVPYIHAAIQSDIDRMTWTGPADLQGKAAKEAIEKYRELVGDSASEGKVVVR